MDKWDFLKEIADSYGLEMTVKEDEAVLSESESGEKIEIYEDKSYSRDTKEEYLQYIVCFSTQHCHFDDLSETEEYIRMILTDEVLPIEFYLDGKRQFGGELTRDQYKGLNNELLAKLFGYTAEYISGFDYEIHSWSGKYNIRKEKSGSVPKSYGEYFMNRTVSDIMDEWSDWHDEWH